MQKKVLILLLFIVNVNYAQSQKVSCLTEALHQQALLNDSAYRNNRAQIDADMAAYAQQNLFNFKREHTRIIPVVFHVIHEGGSENISLEQIREQIAILNADYRRKNSDTINTPGPFKKIASDPAIEFRLAQKDPNGSCSQGVVRIFSPLTNNARDNVKALSYWPSEHYLNIWTVRSIQNTGAGTVLGYAQFPGANNPLIDGVVLRSDVIGTIGSAEGAYGPTEAGRTATHEIGHWLNLYHTWGSKQNCIGTDEVADTPPQEKASSGCPVFPMFDACTTSGTGIMFMNYMDYTDGRCLNLFTIGQKTRMDYTLSFQRNSLTDPQNLIATGTDGSSSLPCAPIADFSINNASVCPETNVYFSDASYNGALISWKWSFPGGKPSGSQVPDPVVTYPQAGVYDVTLTTSNQIGSTTTTKKGAVKISNPIATYTAPYKENFETDDFPGTDWDIVNEDNGSTWKRSTSLTQTRDGRIGIQNLGANIELLKDILISPSIDLTHLSDPHLSFKVAYAQSGTTSSDRLSLYLSKNCGQSWSLIAPYPKEGEALATGGIQTEDFNPNPLQWRTESIDLGPKLTNGLRSNVMFKFEFRNGGGNNIFLDDIQVDNPQSVKTPEAILDMSFYPNPSSKDIYMGFNLFEASECTLSILDPAGREYQVFNKQNLSPGEHRYHIDSVTEPGFYFVRLIAGKNKYTDKLIIY